MTAPLRWPENAEKVRMNSLSNVRKIREHALKISRIAREIEVMKISAEILELTHTIEIALNSVKSGTES